MRKALKPYIIYLNKTFGWQHIQMCKEAILFCILETDIALLSVQMIQLFFFLVPLANHYY